MGIVYMNINTNTVKGCVVYVQIMSFGGIIQKGFDIVPLHILSICGNSFFLEHQNSNEKSVCA